MCSGLRAYGGVVETDRIQRTREHRDWRYAGRLRASLSIRESGVGERNCPVLALELQTW